MFVGCGDGSDWCIEMALTCNLGHMEPGSTLEIKRENRESISDVCFALLYLRLFIRFPHVIYSELCLFLFLVFPGLLLKL